MQPRARNTAGARVIYPDLPVVLHLKHLRPVGILLFPNIFTTNGFYYAKYGLNCPIIGRVLNPELRMLLRSPKIAHITALFHTHLTLRDVMISTTKAFFDNPEEPDHRVLPNAGSRSSKTPRPSTPYYG
jgi:hypothetical protein